MLLYITMDPETRASETCIFLIRQKCHIINDLVAQQLPDERNQSEMFF